MDCKHIEGGIRMEGLRKHHFGSVFRIHRMANAQRMKDIEMMSKIASSRISGFENGKFTLSKNEMAKLYHAIGMRFEIHNDSFEIIESILQSFYRSISYLDERHTYHWSEFQKYKSYCLYDDSFIVYKLGEFIDATYFGDETYAYEEVIQILLDHIRYLKNDLKQMFYDTLGTYYEKIFDKKTALIYFQKGMECNASDSILSMIYYHQSLALMDVGHYVEALSTIKKAKKLFDRELNLKRSVLSSIIMGNAQTLLGYCDKGEVIYLQCISSWQTTSFWSVTLVYRSLVWKCILSKNYEKAISYAQKAMRIDLEHAGILNFFCSYAYWGLGKQAKALEYIRLARNQMESEDFVIQEMIYAFSKFLSDHVSLDKKEKYLLKAYESAIAYNSLQLQTFIIEIMTNLNFSKDDFGKQIKYRDLFIKLLQKRK